MDHDGPDEVEYIAWTCARNRGKYIKPDPEKAIDYSKDIVCAVGDTVLHIKFGYGIVQTAVPGKITVKFENNDERQFVASNKIARLP